MAKKNIFENVADVSTNIRKGKDKAYVLGNELKEKAKSIADKFKIGDKDTDTAMESQSRAIREETTKRLQQNSIKSNLVNGQVVIDGVVVDGAESIKLDENRKKFDEVGEFNDVTANKAVLMGEEIENWLKGITNEEMENEDDEYAKYLASKDGVQVEKTQEVDVKGMKRRIGMAQLFKEEFENSNSFDEKTTMYNQISGLSVSEDNIERLSNLTHILSAYCGDLGAVSLLNAIKNNEIETRMSAIIREQLEGKISYEIATQKLFAEIHGIDSRQLTKLPYKNEALVYLAAIQELTPHADISDIANLTAHELKSIRDAIINGKTFENRKFLAEMGVRNNINIVLKTGDIRITDLKTNGRSSGYLCYDKNVLDDVVDITMNDGFDYLQLGTADENGIIEGSLDEITDIITSHDIGKIKEEGLGQAIERNREITQIEASKNKMSNEEKIKYEQEEAIAVAEAMSKYKNNNFASGV